MDISYVLDLIGYYGPYIQAIIVLIVINANTNIVFIYTLGLLLSNLFNNFLKQTIKQDRPPNQVHTDIENICHNYGMPSYHMQCSAFSIAFLFCTIMSYRLLVITSTLGLLSFKQRHKFRRHTFLQLVVGTIVGAILGWITYLIIKLKV
jgi:membrane-associated phospholipid phosphatase